MKIEELLNARAKSVEDALSEYLSGEIRDAEALFEAMRYSALGAGKRIRPFLTFEFCRLYGGNDQAALPFACALEMIHNYSLIHDDLPCMDNDDFRRGKPTNHKKFGEATAMLAGDALLTYAFGVCASDTYVSAETTVRAVRLLSEAAGQYGMCGGQMIDLGTGGAALTLEDLERLHLLKTGALFRAAALLGYYAAVPEPDPAEVERITRFSHNVGLAFQFRDDLLDAEEGEDNSDAKNGRVTVLSFLTKEEAERRIRDLSESAVSSISHLEGSEMLASLVRYLSERKK